MVSTINGDANVPFYKELGNQGIKATDIPVVAFSVGEEELAGLDTKPLVGHLAAWNYFESIKTPANEEFIAKWKAFTKNPKRITNDPMEAHVIGFDMWVKAVEKAGSDRSRQGDRRAARHRGAEPDRRHLEDAAEPSHHQAGVHRRNAAATASSTWCGRPRASVPGDAWSDYLPGSKDLDADWVTLKCGNYNKVTKKCGGAGPDAGA